MTDEEEKQSFTAQFRKSFRQSHRMSAIRDAINSKMSNAIKDQMFAHRKPEEQ